MNRNIFFQVEISPKENGPDVVNDNLRIDCLINLEVKNEKMKNWGPL